MPTDQPQQLLQRFGLSEFRPGQQDVIDAVLDGHDCLCIMPTGGGKSLCYQVPAIARKGVTIVVSPLIALMKDQVDTLQELGIRADLINSTLSADEQTSRLNQLANSEFELIYVAPERFRSPRFLDAVRAATVTLLAVDEAHCISEWGHDFRHDYARLGTFRQRLGNPQTIALTATATQEVRDDVAKQLALQQPKVFVAGFARPNLHYRAMQLENKPDKLAAVTDYVGRQAGSGIIYASTRKGCEEIAGELRGSLRRRTLVYHGGLQSEERREIQEEFMREANGLVVATNAFGMGIDKPDVRFVIHFNIPGTLEAYYQEAGRAGRDGSPSDCLLLYSSRDRYIQEFFIESAHPRKDTIAAVYEYLRKQESDPIELTQDELKDALDIQIGTDGVGTCERLLERAGVLERLEPNRNMAALRIDSDASPLVDLLPAQAKKQRKVMRAIDQLIGSRRYERVFFRPIEIAAKLDVDITALSTSLRQLSKLDCFDYVPPFRGRAVHMLRRDLPFGHLEIDFEEVEQRRRASLAKLQRVIQYALSNGCRQLEILGYFGDHSADVCGNCDGCVRLGKSARAASAAPSSNQILDAVKMVLSGVARSRERFGASLVAAMLCGSTAAKVSKWKLDQLSTFGLLSFLKQTECAELIKAIVAAQMLEQSDVDRFRPTLKMTALGRQVMTGRAPMPAVSISRNVTAKIVSNHGINDKSIADAIPNTTPTGKEDSRIERDSPTETAPNPTENAETRRIDSSTDALAPPHATRPSHYWTWRLLHDGYSMDECLKIRRIKTSTALDHLVRACEDGLEMEIDWIINESELLVIEQIINNTQLPASPSMALPAGIHYQHLQIFLKLSERKVSALGKSSNIESADDIVVDVNSELS